MNNYYSKFISRNTIIIPANLQKKISNKVLLLAGCGLGSNIGILAARLGFQKFIVADGDKVTISNLNRQVFLKSDIGKNKAVALKNIIKKINPSAEIRVIKKYIVNSDVTKLIKGVDFIINTIDFDQTFIELTDIAKKNNITVIVPFNIGFGSLILVFNKNSINIKKLINNSTKNNFDLYYNLYKVLKIKLPVYFLKRLNKIFKIIKICKYSPQIGIASYLNSSLIITIILKILLKEKVKVAPKPIFIDLKELLHD